MGLEVSAEVDPIRIVIDMFNARTVEGVSFIPGEDANNLGGKIEWHVHPNANYVRATARGYHSGGTRELCVEVPLDEFLASIATSRNGRIAMLKALGIEV